MAFKLGSNSRGGFTTMAEINVTPMVDVMLVLLIIFMVSAPLMKQGAQVDLPKANAGALNDQPNHVYLSITSDRVISIDHKALAKGGLRGKLKEISQANPDAQIYVQADQSLPYGLIAELIAEVKQAGLHRVGLVTQPGSTNGTGL